MSEVDADPRYLAVAARDARFDGRFFTGVTSTGIYCRPVCRVKLPKRSNCVFFDWVAQAEAAGFRPCMRCRPELAPRLGLAWSHTDAQQTLAMQAASLLEASNPPLSPAELAARLGVSGRHLRRIFEAHWGVAPLQAIQTQRLLMAKTLLTDTRLPMAQVALSSGFSSLRRFNDVFLNAYRLAPLRFRKTSGGAIASHELPVRMLLSYRPPMDTSSLLGYLRTRQINGIENVATNAMDKWTSSGIRIKNPFSGTASASLDLLGWVSAEFLPLDHKVRLTVSANLAMVLPQVLMRVRAWLDLDADPQAIDAVLGKSFPGLGGLRVPGSLDGFALAVRAVLGQQVTVAAGRTLTQRVCDRFGEDLPCPSDHVRRVFPSAATLAKALPEDLGALGIVSQRQRALIALARAVDSGGLVLDSTANVDATLQHLQSLPGIGPWTANYIAMRALRWPDAFVAGDVALQKALGMDKSERDKPAAAAKRAETLSQAWRPWRSYAVVRAWSGLQLSNTHTEKKA